MRERERAIRQWGVGRDFADSLGRAQRGIAEKLSAVEGIMATKLDRVRVQHGPGITRGIFCNDSTIESRIHTLYMENLVLPFFFFLPCGCRVVF